MKAPVPLLFFCLAIPLFPQDQPTPTLRGYVTRAASPSDFDVNGVRILCSHETLTAPTFGAAYTSGCPQNTPYIGLAMDVYGTREKKLNAIDADHLVARPAPLETVSGDGIVEAVSARSPHSLNVLADGYRILITPSTRLRFDAPLHGLADAGVNVWIKYKGRQQPDGSLRAVSARFTPDLVPPSAETERYRTNYDPSSVTKPVNHAAEAFIGVNAQKIPVWHNPAMQARVAAIGSKLIPACQRTLPVSSPIRIGFRFQVTSGDPWLPQVLALPSGIILVPHQIVDRLQNDSQLAAILADAIAVELEAQDSRMELGVRPTRKQFAKDVALEAGAMAAYGAPEVLFGAQALHELRKEEDQTGRVSLDLMHDAGYDITQAPIAWWLLASSEPRPIQDIPIPERAAALYRVLGVTWRPSTPATP